MPLSFCSTKKTRARLDPDRARHVPCSGRAANFRGQSAFDDSAMLPDTAEASVVKNFATSRSALLATDRGAASLVFIEQARAAGLTCYQVPEPWVMIYGDA